MLEPVTHIVGTSSFVFCLRKLQLNLLCPELPRLTFHVLEYRRMEENSTSFLHSFWAAVSFHWETRCSSVMWARAERFPWLREASAKTRWSRHGSPYGTLTSLTLSRKRVSKCTPHGWLQQGWFFSGEQQVTPASTLTLKCT